MLAKQEWRLLTSPNSLCSRIIKARYYPKSDFLNAKLGCNPSFAWRSILSSKSLVEAGARRRIGNGQDTRIWGVPWLLNEEQPLVTFAIPAGAAKVTVDALFIPGQQKWDNELIKDLFVSRDCDEIQAIP